MIRPRDAIGDLRDLRESALGVHRYDDSRDLDQLTTARAAAAGRVRILWPWRTSTRWCGRIRVDDHASHNTTSVYTPAAISPSAEALSTGLTSLTSTRTG